MGCSPSEFESSYLVTHAKPQFQREIVERRAPLPVTRPFGPDFAVADRYAAWDVSGVTSFELVTVRRFLERRWQLDPAARGRLGWELAERLRPKVAGAPADLHPEHFLEALAEAKAARG